MLARLFLLFTLIPLVELTLLVWIAQHTNWIVTLALIFLPGFLGAWLARREGLRCLRAAIHQVRRGELPTDSLLDGVLVLVAGALLITPGVLTDLTGFLLLIPAVRQRVRRHIVRRIRARFGLPPSQDDDSQSGPRIHIVDVEARDPKQGEA